MPNASPYFAPSPSTKRSRRYANMVADSIVYAMKRYGVEGKGVQYQELFYNFVYPYKNTGATVCQAHLPNAML
jgi:hypothetical protein